MTGYQVFVFLMQDEDSVFQTRQVLTKICAVILLFHCTKQINQEQEFIQDLKTGQCNFSMGLDQGNNNIYRAKCEKNN